MGSGLHVRKARWEDPVVGEWMGIKSRIASQINIVRKLTAALHSIKKMDGYVLYFFHTHPIP